MYSESGTATLSLRPKLSAHVASAIEKTIGSLAAERGGMLGINCHTGVVDAFHFDSSADGSHTTYSPDLEALRPLREA